MFDGDPSLPLGADSYSIFYQKINGCNVVIDNLSKVSGTDQEKNALLGQVLFLRAYYYLKLVSIYSQPYSGKGIDPKVSLGVPLILTSTVSDNFPARNTLAEVYTQVEKDLIEAAALLKANFTESGTFRVGYIAAYSLLTRMYLYMGRDADMDNVITYADKVLQERNSLTQLKSFFSNGYFANQGIYDVTQSPEVIWVYGANPNAGTAYFPQMGYDKPPYTVSGTLAALYDQGTSSDNMGDLRYVSYLGNGYANGASYKSYPTKVGYSAVYGSSGIRLGEVYLNRAEAYARKYTATGNAEFATKALSDLNTLRASRYDTRSAAYVPVSFNNAADLYKFCQEERRRELCLEEGHRWMDIKRWGLSLSHHYIDENGVGSDATLASGSLVYALPIPYTAITRNYKLLQNPR